MKYSLPKGRIAFAAATSRGDGGCAGERQRTEDGPVGDERAIFEVSGWPQHREERRLITLKLWPLVSGNGVFNGQVVEFDAVVRIDTPGEADYYRNGGIMQYVLRSLRAGSA